MNPGPILEKKGMQVIFSEKGQKKGEIFENVGNNV